MVSRRQYLVPARQSRPRLGARRVDPRLTGAGPAADRRADKERMDQRDHRLTIEHNEHNMTTKEVDMEGWLTVPQVARNLGVSNQTVRNWIRRRKLTAIRGVERGVYRIPAPELEAFKRRSASRVEPPYLPVETRDLTSPEAFYEARIAPALAQAGEPSADRLLVRVAAEDALRRRFPTFARDYAHYVGQIADQLEAVSGL